MERYTKNGAFKERCNGNIPYAEIISFVSKIEDLMEKYQFADFKELKSWVDWTHEKSMENHFADLKQENDELKQQLSRTEKALELACEKLPMEYEYCSNHPERYNLQDEYGSDEPYWVEDGGCEFDSPENCLNCVVNYFKTKAKEMMKSE